MDEGELHTGAELLLVDAVPAVVAESVVDDVAGSVVDDFDAG